MNCGMKLKSKKLLTNYKKNVIILDNDYEKDSSCKGSYERENVVAGSIL